MESLKNKVVSIPEEILNIPAERFAFAGREDVFYDAVPETESRGFFRDALVRLRKNKASVLAFWILCVIVVMAIIGPTLTPYTFSQQFPEYTNMPPRVQLLENFGFFDGSQTLTNRRLDSLEDTSKFPEGCIIGYSNPHEVRGVTLVDVEVNYYKYIGADDTYFWFGTDGMGRDVWTRLWRGARVSLIIALAAVLSDVAIGVVYGSIAGYYGGKLDLFMMRVCEIINAFPNVVVCTLCILLFGSGIPAMILALMIRGWVPTARMVRAQFLRFRGREYVMAAQTMGIPDRALIFRHILPNSIGPIITRTMIAIPNAIFTESFLAFIGLGLAPPEPSIGTLLSSGQKVLMQYPHLTLFPAFTISVLMIAFNLFGNGLRDAMDPTQRGHE